MSNYWLDSCVKDGLLAILLKNHSLNFDKIAKEEFIYGNYFSRVEFGRKVCAVDELPQTCLDSYIENRYVDYNSL